MDISTVYAKNLTKQPVNLGFLINELDKNHIALPQQKIELKLQTPVAIYQLLQCVTDKIGVIFYAKDGTTEITPDLAKQIYIDYDLKNGAHPYRDLESTGDLKVFTDAVYGLTPEPETNQDASPKVQSLAVDKELGKVNVSYVDDSTGESISKAVTEEGEVGTKVTIKPITITGYTNPSPTQKTLTYSNEVQTVEFRYTAK